MPFANDLFKHSTRLYDLLNCIDATNRVHEFLGRYLKNNTEINAKLYTPIVELEKFKDIPKHIDIYNENVYYKHRPESCIFLENGFAFIKGYESNTVKIVHEIIDLTKEGIVGYRASVQSWLSESGYSIDSPEKKQLLENMFESSKVALIYGSAGTGKSTMIKHISAFFASKRRLYLANTHTAVDNLKRIVKGDANQFKTVKKCINNERQDCDILIIDECSTISNADMAKILDNVTFKLLILVGDIYQIESIKFGNWFSIAKEFVPKSAICELTYVHRSTDTHLKKLWESVRKLDGNMQALLESHHYCSPLSETIFEKQECEDEIVLCLNYDGLYGINNINHFLQEGLNGKVVEYNFERYRVGDPIIFIETDRFGELLYNNLKGTIVGIQEEEKQIKFTIEVDKALNSLDVDGYSLSLETPIHDNKSVISFYVGKFVNKDDDDRGIGDIIPFKIAHAVSIHKAQGLEYDSVKIVITDEVGELISHNIFYTAITRAKNKLKIYWSAETEKKILEGMHFMFNREDAAILNRKFKLKHN
ncbi:MAG: ATP-dependent RecD-like DNA helicase [Clostridiales bacterium]|nr:ATP-dependent RecD-like DNA helicase [Clostridiales bacterium]